MTNKEICILEDLIKDQKEELKVLEQHADDKTIPYHEWMNRFEKAFNRTEILIELINKLGYKYDYEKQEIKRTKKVYQWAEVWDGGRSKYFKNFIDCKKAAQQHIKDIQWTKQEMKLQKEKNENYVLIEICTLDEDGSEIAFKVCYSLEVNEKTVDRVY